MASIVKIINPDQQSSLQIIQENKILFETEMSQDPQGQDKQFSPWVKKPINKQLPQNQRYTSHMQNIQFLNSIKHRKYNVNPSQSPQSDNNNLGSSRYNLDRDFQAKAQHKFKELIKKSFKQKKQFQAKFRLSQRAKHINLNLNWDAQPTLTITPILKSFSHRIGNQSDEQQIEPYRIKKPLRHTSLSHDRKISSTSQSNRFSIFKTQQLFYKTLELSLPIQSKKKQLSANLGSKNSPSRKTMAFPHKEKLKVSRTHKNSEQQSKEYKITGQSINFTHSRGFNRPRRHNLKPMHQIDNGSFKTPYF